MDKTRCISAGLALLGLAQAAVAADPPGKTVYQGTCIACHGANGKGALPGVPDLTKKSGVLSKPDDVLAKNIINGFQTPGSPMAMPPKGGDPNLTEQQTRQVIEYMRQAFGR